MFRCLVADWRCGFPQFLVGVWVRHAGGDACWPGGYAAMASHVNGSGVELVQSPLVRYASGPARTVARCVRCMGIVQRSSDATRQAHPLWYTESSTPRHSSVISIPCTRSSAHQHSRTPCSGPTPVTRQAAATACTGVLQLQFMRIYHGPRYRPHLVRTSAVQAPPLP